MSRFLQTASCDLMTEFGQFRLHGFQDAANGLEHAALCLGDMSDPAPVLARVHSECLTGDVFHSLHCDCGAQLCSALERIAAHGRGALLYLRQEGRGIGLVNKIRAYALQQRGADTVDANRLLGLPDDARDYAIAAEMFASIGIRDVHLMTNNPAKVESLTRHGVRVSERVALQTPRTAENGAYLDTKAARMGHLLSPGGDEQAEPGGRGFCLSRRER